MTLHCQYKIDTEQDFHNQSGTKPKQVIEKIIETISVLQIHALI